MAINTTTYSLQQWKFAIIPETTVGTAVTASMHLVDVDKPITVTENVFIDDSPRDGTGRTIKSSDWFATEEGQLSSITVSGYADKTTFPIMAENATGVAEASETIDVPYNYTGPAIGVGDTPISDNIHTLTIAHVSPITNKSRIWAGCVVSELNWVDDVTAEGGRRRFTATFQTRAIVTNSTTDPTYANSGALYGTYYSVWDYCGANGIIQLGGQDCVLGKLDVTISGNPRWHGCGTDGAGQTIARGLPIMDIFGSVDVKFDSNTEPFVQDYADGDDFVVQILDNSTIASATLGIKAEYTKINSDVPLIDVEDGAFQTVPFKCTGSTSGNIAQIPV